MSMYAYWLANTGLTVHKLTGLMTEGIGAEELYALQESQMKKIRVLDEKDVGKITQSRRQWDVQGTCTEPDGYHQRHGDGD